jgi:hypothetical protein
MSPSEEFPEELKRYWRGPTDADRAEMLAAIGEDKRFHVLTEELKASVFRAMFHVRFYMDSMRRVADGQKARTLKRGPKTFELALRHIVEMRHSSHAAGVALRLPNDLFNDSNQLFNLAQAWLEACCLDVTNSELAYEAPSANETWAQAKLQEAERLRTVLAAVRIRSYELIGKMCCYTSGKAVGEDAIKTRFATRD